MCSVKFRRRTATNYSSVCFSPDGKTFLTSGDPEPLILWDVKTGECIYLPKRDINTVCRFSSICFSPDGKLILSVKRRKIQLWDVTMKEAIKTFDHDFDSWMAVCFSPNGKMAISITSSSLTCKTGAMAGFARKACELN